jgi:hypothetical protein
MLDNETVQAVTASLLNFAIAVLLAGLTAQVPRLRTFIKAKSNAQFAQLLEQAIYAALDYAKQRHVPPAMVRDLEPQQPRLPNIADDALVGSVIDETVKARVVQSATDYVADKMPDTLKNLGLSNAQLEEMVQARLPQVFEGAASSAITGALRRL